MKQVCFRRTIILVLWVAFCITSTIAGPLDRDPMRQRYNPSTENMLRIPGVVGMYEQEAVDLLQQIGLSVNVKYIRKKKRKYVGKEGVVVEQIPSVAGVAMLGSSVMITVYLPTSPEPDDLAPIRDIESEENYETPESYPDEGRRGWDDGRDYTDDEGSFGWGAGGDIGGWMPPPQQDGLGAGDASIDKRSGSPRGFQGDRGRDVPNVLPDAGGVVNGRSPIPPGRLPRAVSTSSGKDDSGRLLTPAQRRKLDKAMDRSRAGGLGSEGEKPDGKKGIGNSGVIAGRPNQDSGSVSASGRSVPPSE